KAASTHQKQVECSGFVEGLPAPETQCRLSLFGKARSKIANALSGRDAVRILLIVEFQVGFRAIAELMANEQAPAPTLRHSMVAEVVANLAVEPNGTDARVDFEWQKEGRPGSDQATRNGAGGIVEEELWAGGYAE